MNGTEAPPTPARIQTLDFLRGIAVMGILLANLPAFALPDAAYFSPAAWGGTTPADQAAWYATFVFVEGRMRGLFSLLFGASMLLVIQRAEAAGYSGAAVHLRRMAWLFVIGCAHLYLVWSGDILAHYALCGAIALAFVRLPVRWLIAAAVALILFQTATDVGLYTATLAAQADPADPASQGLLAAMALGFGVPPPAHVAAEFAAHRGSYVDVLAWRWRESSTSPLSFLLILGPETLATMLLGMAGLKSGFLTGAWPRRRYMRWAAVALGVSLPIYAAAGLHTMAGGFAMRDVILGSMTLSTVLRAPAIVGYAALGILLMRPGGWLTDRIAAAGRAAFSNYLGTSLVMTTIFYGYGLGQYGHRSRAELVLFALPAWVAMLAWSKPWLTRHSHGPAEWVWRTLASFPTIRLAGTTNR